jgi:type I restriction enzyme, S subunit
LPSAILKPDGSCDTDFLYLFLRSPFAYSQATAAFTGTAQPTVPLRPLRRFAVPVPPLGERRRIVDTVQRLMRLCDDLEARLFSAEEIETRLASAAAAAMVA